MRKIVIPDETPIGLSGNRDSVCIAIFLDEDPIELIFPIEAAKAVAAILEEGLLQIKAHKEAA